MDIIELTQKEILLFMIDKNIPLRDLRFNGEDHYKADGEIDPEHEKMLKQKLIELATFEKRIEMLVKHHYGSYEKMDKELKKSGHRAKFKRWIKHSKEMAAILKSKPNIK
jgi:hypothetical protein